MLIIPMEGTFYVLYCVNLKSVVGGHSYKSSHYFFVLHPPPAFQHTLSLPSFFLKSYRCGQDCASSNTDDTNKGICSGIITESSTKLYDTISKCCSAQLSYIDSYLCEVRSTKDKAEDGTFRLYPNVNTGSCGTYFVCVCLCFVFAVLCVVVE